VMPAGGGLVPPSPGGPVQSEGETGPGDEPGGVLPGESGKPDGLGDRQLDTGDAGRAELAAADRDGRVAEGNQQVSVTDSVVVRGVAGVLPAAGDGGSQGDAPGERAADGSGPELGQGGQGGVAADAALAPGLALVPAERGPACPPGAAWPRSRSAARPWSGSWPCAAPPRPPQVTRL